MPDHAVADSQHLFQHFGLVVVVAPVFGKIDQCRAIRFQKGFNVSGKENQFAITLRGDVVGIRQDRMRNENRIIDKCFDGFADRVGRGMVRVWDEFLAKQILKAPIRDMQVCRRKLEGVLFQYGQGRKSRGDEMADADILVVVQGIASVLNDAPRMVADLIFCLGIDPLAEFAPPLMLQGVIAG